MIFIFTTLNNKKIAEKIGKELLKKRIVACYNLLPIESAYWWKGKIAQEKEVLMIFKSRKQNFEKVENYLKKHSGYETPEVVAIEPSKVSKPYLGWIHSETKS
jgi:periplasmic divalent cation tolerance protein